LKIGDYDTAVAIYGNLLSEGSEVSMQAKLGQGTAYLRDGKYVDASSTLREFFAIYPESNLTPDVHFLLAEALVGAGEPMAAVDEYRAYLASHPILTAYVNEWIADALHVAGEYEAAVEAYEVAIAEAPTASFLVSAREKLALSYVALENYAAAIAQYDAILDVAAIRAYRARIEHQAAETLLLAGQTEDGYDRHLSVIETYPDEYYAYLSLVVLVEAGRAPDDYLRGVVDYYGGAYGPAVEALYRYINTYPDTHAADAHWYIGLSYLKAGSPELAAGEFETLIETHPEDRRVGDAWMGLAEAQNATGHNGLAVSTYQTFVELLPDHARTPEALWKAARLVEQADDPAGAAGLYMTCHVQYPSSDYGSPALFRSGLQSYLVDNLTDATVAWDTLAELYPDSSYRPAARLWLGKVRLARGDAEAAQAAFADIISADPTDYYALRAADLSADPDTPTFSAIPYTLDYNVATEQTEAETWLASWLGLEDTPGLGRLSPDLTADSRLQRGLELWRLGRFQFAKWELEALRQDTASDVLAQYQLALLFRDIGLYRSSILCARNVVDLSPAEAVLDAPPFIARLVYPTYYRDLIEQNAELSGLDPLLVFSTVRQESLFESFATSYASAHGLMQVIPDTGNLIAAQLGWPPGYETGDLYKPYVSVRFGTYYLAQQRDRFDGRLDAALAGYNGGPVNADRWLNAASGDPDLLVELITFSETRAYVRLIREHYAIYQALYGER
jgi:soluble lytic murein transglycosylase